MFIRLDTKSEVPLCHQLTARIEDLIAAGRLGVGECLPSVRELAVDLRINPNTVLRAYRELEQAGVLAMQGDDARMVRVDGDPCLGREKELEYRRSLREAVAVVAGRGIQRKRAGEVFEEVADAVFGALER